MLNKSDRETLNNVIAVLRQLIAGHPVSQLKLEMDGAKGGVVKESPFYGMNKNRIAVYKKLFEKYGEKQIAVKDNEFLRRAFFDCKVASVGLTIQTFEERGLAIRELETTGKKRLLSFLLVRADVPNI